MDKENSNAFESMLTASKANQSSGLNFMINEFIDDVGDFVDITKSRGIGEAFQATKDKFLGVQAPEINKDEWTSHADGALQTRTTNPGITDFQDSGSFGKLIDPNAFLWGGGATGDKSYLATDADGVRDIAFAGRPGEYRGNDFTEWQPFQGSDTEFMKDREGSLKWMSPGDGGRGLVLSSGEKMPDNALTKIKKIYSLKEETEKYNTELQRGAFYDKELGRLNKGLNTIESFNERNSYFESQDTYNLAFAKDGKVKAIININKLGDPDQSMQQSILNALHASDADEIYYLDAGGNKDWQIGRDKKGQYDYTAAATIGGTHKGY